MYTGEHIYTHTKISALLGTERESKEENWFLDAQKRKETEELHPSSASIWIKETPAHIQICPGNSHPAPGGGPPIRAGRCPGEAPRSCPPRWDGQWRSEPVAECSDPVGIVFSHFFFKNNKNTLT